MAHVKTAVRSALARRRRLRTLFSLVGIALALALVLRIAGPIEGQSSSQRQAAPTQPAKLAVAAAAAGAAEEPAALGTTAAAGAGAGGAAAGDTTAAAAAAAAGDAASSGSGSSGGHGTGIFFDVPAAKEGDPPTRMEMLAEPVPEDCHLEEQADYDGPGLTWGLSYKKASAAQCCQACKERSQPDPEGRFCNVWVWCGSPTGDCWSPDIWNHTTGECWLKYQKDWDNNVDRAASNLAVNRRGAYPPEYRAEHKTAPEAVAWTAGVIPSVQTPAGL